MPKRTEMAILVISTAEPRCSHAVCPLQVHPPTSPIPPFLLKQNLSPKDIAGSGIMKLKVSRQIYVL